MTNSPRLARETIERVLFARPLSRAQRLSSPTKVWR